MKLLTLILSISIGALFLSFSNLHTDRQSINPILGDISFVEKFGELTACPEEDLRIKTHLAYVEDLLRQKNVSGLSPELREKREHLLDLLHAYWTEGKFPRNYDHPGERVPCFIDMDGNICAVGYLVEQTAGRKIAEEINNEHQYDELLAMNDRTVDSWIKESGLTQLECAMIQPMYGWNPPPQPIIVNENYIAPEIGVASSLLGGINLSLNAINAIQVGKGAQSKAIPFFSLFTGAGSIILGTLTMPNDKGTGQTNESQKALSMLNIGLGTSTMILAAWNLSVNRVKKPKAVSWNIYSFPTAGMKPGLGISFTKKI